jgi:chemotaxis protein methyltransferase CheR
VNGRDRDLVAELCAERAGLAVDPAKEYLIENRLAPVARLTGYSSAHELICAVRDRGDERLAWSVVEAMSPSETAFFRDAATLDSVIDDLFADFAPGRQGEPVRIWSASCGTGQEAYSLAMLLAERAPTGAQIDLLASDISERRLETAQAGVYSQFEVQRGLSARRLVRHFERDGENFCLSPHLRHTLRWRRVNLLDEPIGLGRFDLIVCRQLLSGLLEPARARVVENLCGALKPQGRLLFGAAEAVPGLSAESSRPGLFSRNGQVQAAA